MFKIVPKKSLVIPQLSRFCVNGFFQGAPLSSAHAGKKQAGVHQQFKAATNVYFQKPMTKKKLGEDQPIFGDNLDINIYIDRYIRTFIVQ